MKSIGGPALTKNGTAALSFRFTRESGDYAAGLALWSPANGFSKLVLQTDLPEFGDDWLIDFADISLDDAGRVFFAAAGQVRNWIYVMRDGEIRKIVADGEATPLGGTFHLALPPPIFDLGTPLPPSAYLEVTTTNGNGDIAFLADVRGTDYGRIPFLWSGGRLLPIPFRDGKAGEPGGLNVTRLSPARSFTGENLLLAGSLCCPDKNAVFFARPAVARHNFIPLVALGRSNEIQYLTRVDFVNHSHFPGVVLLTPHWEGAEPGSLSVGSWVDFVPPGETLRKWVNTAGSTGVFRGYLEVAVEGGAGISTSATVEVWRNQDLLSKTVLPATTSTTETEIPIEREAGEKAFALANTADSDSQVTFTLLDASGAATATKKKQLSPGQHTSFLLCDLFPGLAQSFLGRFRAQSSKPFLLTALTMTGFQVSRIPAVKRSADTARKWSLVPVYPGWVKQVTTSRAGSIAFQVNGNGIRVVEEGEVYDVLAEKVKWPNDATTTLPPQRDEDVQLIGFSSDQGLYFTAHCEPNDPNLVALFHWHPGEITPIARAGDQPEPGSHLQFDAHTSSRVSASGALYVTALRSDEQGIVKGTDVYRFDGAFHKLFSVDAYSVAKEHMDVSGDEVAFSTSDRLVFWKQGVLYTIMQGGQIPGGQNILPIDELVLSPAGKVYLRSLSGLYVSDGVKTERIIAPGDPAPGMPGYRIDYIGAISVNARDHLVYQAGVRETDATWSPTAFFQVATTTTQQTVLVPQGGDFEKDMWTFGTDFQWTDEDELIFFGSRPAQAGIFARRSSGTELVTTPRLATFDDPPRGWFSSVSDVWPSSGPEPLLTIRTSGAEPFGLYQAVPDNVQTFVFPVVASASVGDIGYESSFLITNNDGRKADLRVWLYESAGTVRWTGQTAAAPGETRLLPIAEAGSFSGWARIEVTGGSVAIIQRLTHRQAGEVVSQFEVPSSGPRTESFLGPGDYREVASVALVNPYNAPQEVIVELLESGMEVAYQERITLPPNGRKAVYLSELFPGVSTVGSRLFRFQSPMPISVLGLSFQEECMVPYTRVD